MVEECLFLRDKLCWFKVDTDEAICLLLPQRFEEMLAVLGGPLPWIGYINFILSVGILKNEKSLATSYLSYSTEREWREVTGERWFVGEGGELVAKLCE